MLYDTCIVLRAIVKRIWSAIFSTTIEKGYIYSFYCKYSFDIWISSKYLYIFIQIIIKLIIYQNSEAHLVRHFQHYLVNHYDMKRLTNVEFLTIFWQIFWSFVDMDDAISHNDWCFKMMKTLLFLNTMQIFHVSSRLGSGCCHVHKGSENLSENC
jgi:hypothetical protein